MTSNDYDQYLRRSAAIFAAQGAQVMLASGMRSSASWTVGWDQILLVQAGGTSTLYAFTHQPPSPQSLQDQIDALAAGLAGQQLLGQIALHVVAIVVVDTAITPDLVRRYRRTAPHTFFQGLRPETVVVDLPRERVISGRPWSNEATRLLRQALPASGVVPASPEVLAHLQAQNVARTNAFYALMRGRMPIVTYLLIAINVGIYLALYLTGSPDSTSTLRTFGALSPHLVLDGQWWRIFTSMFLHASIPHILFNMTSLFAIGTLAERLYGSWRYLAIYIGAGLIGSLVSLGYSILTNNLDILGVGASGAIFGVAGALIAVRFHASAVIPQRLRSRVSTSLLPLIAISLIFSFLTPYVDNSAHIGGLLGGAALSFVFPLVKEMPGALTTAPAEWS